MAQLIPTTVVGSYPQPDWLVDREQLRSRLPPRVRAREIWRIPDPYLEQAQDDATLLAIHDMERAGVDIISDGEMRRESYSNRFATALDGVKSSIQARRSIVRGIPTRCRASSARSAAHGRRGVRPGVPATQHRPAHQDHRSRPVHRHTAGAKRVLSR